MSAPASPPSPWTPLPAGEWDRLAARHLASRLGFSLAPSWIDAVFELGPRAAVRALLGKRYPFHPPPDGPDEPPALRSERQQEIQRAYAEFGLGWLAFAREPLHSPQEKLVLFFQDVWVASFQGVRDAALLRDHQDRIRQSLGATYPEMCKRLALSPAMAAYLNLQQNRKGAPNENFARELFELFILGEGNYSERDIQEAARALTGYQIDRANGRVVLRPARHDAGVKEIFGERGRFDLPGVIDLAFRQPAAARFLPAELARAYLNPAGLDAATLEPLAAAWRASGFSLPALFETFFGSVEFFAARHRGCLIKSPTHFLLGALQDLGLDVAPLPRRTLQPLQQMGQRFYAPPNVRGWVGDRHWINTATLGARRRLLEMLLAPLDESGLNADETRALEQAREQGRDRFALPDETLRKLAARPPGQLADWLAERFHAVPDAAGVQQLATSLRLVGRAIQPADAGRLLVLSLMLPAYHLC